MCVCVHLELLPHEINFHMLRFWVSHVLLKVVKGSSQRPRSLLTQQNWDLGYPASGQSLWFQTSRPVDCARWVTSRFPGSYRYHHWYHCHSLDIDTIKKKHYYIWYIYTYAIYIYAIYIYVIWLYTYNIKMRYLFKGITQMLQRSLSDPKFQRLVNQSN